MYKSVLHSIVKINILEMTHLVFQQCEVSCDFRLIEDTPFVILKFKLDNFLHHTLNKIVVKIKYGSLLIDNERNVKFNNFELKIDEDLRIMRNIYY